jgi:murein DD-endopeptidase MepM/ murein hydrolase activator NlpD
VPSRRPGSHRPTAVTPTDALAQGLTRREYRELLERGSRDRAQRSSPRRRHQAAQRRRRRQHLLGRVAPTVATAAVVLGTGSVVAAQQTGLAAGVSTIAASAAAGAQNSSARIASPGLDRGAPLAASRAAARPALSSVAGEVNAARTELRATVRAQAAVDLVTEQTTERTSEVLAQQRWLESFHPPLVGGRVTSEFGPRWGRMHRGIDFGAATGHPLHAVAAGTVTVASYNYGLGYHVRLTLEDGTVISYGHLSRILVEPGQRVRPGDLVGRVGSSGASTGAHLHLEVSVDGDPVDPRPWLVERGLL